MDIVAESRSDLFEKSLFLSEDELVREVAQMLEIMAVGRVEGAGQKNGMIKSLRCLMELEYRVLEKYSAASFR